MTPQERGAYWLAKLGRPPTQTVETPSAPTWDPDLVPDVQYERSDEDRKLDGFLEQVSVVEAYRTFIGKMEPIVGNKTEGVMISCPLPGHPDSHPSAWLNTEKGTWFCGGCQVGGDSYDLAAIGLGHPLESYKHNGTFPKLRREMAKRLGFTVMKTITGGETFIAPAVLSEAEAARVVSEPEPELDDNNLIDLEDFRTESILTPELRQNTRLFIDWEKILPTDSFMRRWMEACSITDLPHEYYFFNGLIALGFAGGTNVYLADEQPVKSNLLVCLYGKTGAGKTRSVNPLKRLLKEVLPYDPPDHFEPPTGVKFVPTPGSPEVLIDHFQFDLQDPSTMKVTGQAQVRGLVNIDEFSAFISVANRTGAGAFRETIMQMSDAYGETVTTSSRKSGTARAYDPYMSMLTSTQPEAIQAYLDNSFVVSGFLNRWIMAWGLPRREMITYGGVPINIDESALALRGVNAWAATPREFWLMGDALVAWDEFARGALLTASDSPLTGRLHLLFKKLIVLLTMNEMLDHPSLEIVERVTSLLPYFNESSRRLGVDLVRNPETDCEDRVRFIIQKLEKKYNQSPGVGQVVHQVGAKYPKKAILQAIKMLELSEYIESFIPKTTKQGRPTTRLKSITKFNEA